MKKLRTGFIFVLVLLMAGCGAPKEPNAELEAWGLGKFESKHVGLDRTYEWYVQQTDINDDVSDRGVSCAMMAGKWVDENFNVTAEALQTFGEQTKEEMHANYEGWTYNVLKAALEYAEVPSEIEKIPLSRYKKKEAILGELNDGNIVVLIIKPNMLTYTEDTAIHAGIYYLGFKSFIVIKGYRVVDKKTYFEVYDPASNEVTYQNGQPFGKDRYYLADEVMTSAEEYMSNYMVIEVPKE